MKFSASRKFTLLLCASFLVQFTFAKTPLAQNSSTPASTPPKTSPSENLAKQALRDSLRKEWTRKNTALSAVNISSSAALNTLQSPAPIQVLSNSTPPSSSILLSSSSTKNSENTSEVSTLNKTSLNSSSTTTISSSPLSTLSDTLIIESLNVKNTDIRDLLQALSLQFGINLYLAPEVKGQISVNFNKIPVKNAIKMIVEENGYQLKNESGILKIVKAEIIPEVKPTRFEVSFTNNKLSVDILDIPLPELVRKLVQITNQNITFDKNLKGNITAFFKDLPLEKGLRNIAQNNEFSLKENDGIYSFYKENWGSEGTQSSEANKNMWIKVKDSTVNIEVNNAPLQNVLSNIASQAGMNIVMYGKPKGNVSAKLKEVPIEEALLYILRESDFTYWKQRGIYFFGASTMKNATTGSMIKMKYMKAEEALEALPPNLTKSTTIKIIKTQNAIMVSGSSEDIDAITDYVNKIDLPVPMILIEALVVDMDLDKVRDYGLKLFIGKPPKPTGQEPLYPAINQVFNRDQAQGFLDNLDKVGLKSVITLPKDFAGQISALEQEKALKVQSRPQIATLNGQTATITVGQTQYYLLKTQTDYTQNNSNTNTNRVTESFSKIDANVTLTVTPYVTGKGEITCEIVPDFSEPEGSFDANTPPTLNRRTLKSNVKLRDGETIILGGMVKESKNQVSNQVPFLGSIPILGWLFKNVSTVTSRSQLMIFVTPHIYYGEDAKVDVNEYLKKIEN